MEIEYIKNIISDIPDEFKKGQLALKIIKKLLNEIQIPDDIKININESIDNEISKLEEL